MEKIRRALSPGPSTLVALALVLAFVGERLIEAGAGRWVTDVVAGICFVAGAGWRALLTGRVEGATGRLSRALLICYGGLLLALACYALSIQVGMESKAAPVLAIAFVALLAIALGPMLALELVTWRMRPAAFVEWRRAQSALIAGLSLAAMVTALGLLNYAAAQRPWRSDLSFGAPTRPSAATQSLLQATTTPVEIYLFFERGSPVLPEVRDYFDGLREAGATVSVLDQASDPDLTKQLKITANGNVGLRCGERTGRWFVGTDVDSARSRLKKMDSEMRTQLAVLTVPKRNVYFTVGHDERPDRAASKGDASGGKKLRDLVRSFNGTVKTLGLAEGLGSRIPDDADLVVVFGPSSAFLAQEVAALRDYLKRGGALLIMVDAGSAQGLEPLLADVGLQLAPGEACNDRAFVQQSYTDADHAFIAATSFGSHKATRTLSGAQGRAQVAFISAGQLSRPADAPAAAKNTFLVRSMPQGFADLNQNRRFDPEDEKRGPLNLATAVELPVEGKSESRAVVIADSDALADYLIGNQANAVFGIELLAWLLREDALGGEVAIEEDVPIRHTREGDTAWFYGTTFAAPALVLAGGLGFVSRKRRRRSAP
ncbi:MAG: Gldg family protein [Deltaproteobacteria bacterium]|nr:Gldg family protein [Deltaproteobacteria bacterium]